MTDMMNLHGFQSQGQPDDPQPVAHTPIPLRSQKYEQIGTVTEISGGGSRIRIDGQRLRALATDPDPSVALSGQVGSQVKLECGRKWLLANVRNLKVSPEDEAVVLAEIDFLGEGDEEEATGKLINFKRGITGYPIPGNRVFPVLATI
jgi:hypothetical protein